MKFVLDYTKNESEKIESTLSMDLCNMEFKSIDEGDMEIYAVEHLDNA